MGKGMNVIIAAAAGFIGGILLAPKSGEETRKDLMNKANDAKRDAARKTEQAKGAMHDGMDTLRSSAKDAGNELSGLANSAKASAGRMADEAKNLSSEAKTRAARVAEKNQRGDELVDTAETINAAPVAKRTK